jgi:hypothetical protein
VSNLLEERLRRGECRVTSVLRRWGKIIFGHAGLFKDVERKIVEAIGLCSIVRKRI